MDAHPIKILEEAIKKNGEVLLVECVGLVKSELANMKNEINRLENTILQSKNELEKCKPVFPENSFLIYCGVKFKKNKEGEIEEAVYCPLCETKMASISKNLPFSCGKCHALSTFKAKDFQSVLLSLKQD